MFEQIYNYLEVTDLHYLVPVYVILQSVMMYKYEGVWRWLSAVLLLPMLIVFLYTVGGYFSKKNLWPLAIFFSIPPAIMYLVLLSFIHYLYHMVKKGLLN